MLSIKFVAQNDRKIFYGKINDELGALSNAHIINLNTKKATFSNDNGEFKIFVKTNDSLKFTSVGYKTQKLIIKSVHLSINETIIFLKKEVYELDEIELKNHNLTGSIALDFKQTPKDKKAEALTKTMDFSKINMKAKTKDDYIDNYVRPHIVETDPTKTQGVSGTGAKVNMAFKYSERLWALRRELAFKENFSSQLLKHFGEDFFFNDLKIPVEKYPNFISYCSFLDIEKLYKERKFLEVIKILRNEHVEYLKTIKKE